jgi:hypothetical protein
MPHRSTDRPARRRSPRGLASIDSSGDIDDYVVVARQSAAPSGSAEGAGEADDGSTTDGESADDQAETSLQEQLAVVVVILELLIVFLRFLLRLLELITTYLIPLLRSLRMTLGISLGEA